MKKLMILLLIISYAYAAHDGVFYSGKTKITVGNQTIEESRMGSVLGIATGGIYRLETLFGFYTSYPDIKITHRSYTISFPELYTGASQNAEIIPGSQLHFSISLQNIAAVTANNCLIEDLVPEHTHFYKAIAPTLTGNCTNIMYEGITQNVGARNTISFRFDLAPLGKATMNYTVTVD